MKESTRFLNNAREILLKSTIEDDTYLDIKYVQEACGTAYLAILKAIDAYLMSRGVAKKELPRSEEGYRKALNKYVTPHNGKLSREFEKLYDGLHIAGYYRGLLKDTNAVKGYFKAAKGFIDKVDA